MKTIEELQKILDRYAVAAGATDPLITTAFVDTRYFISVQFDGAQWFNYKNKDELDANPESVLYQAMMDMLTWHQEANDLAQNTE